MTSRSGFNDLRLPFIFVPHGQPEPPEVAAFKARYPGWFAIPATFVPQDPGVSEDWAEHTAQQKQHPSRMEPSPSDAETVPPVETFRHSHLALNDPAAALRVLGGDPNTSSFSGSSHPYVAIDPEQWIGKPSVGTGECVPLVQLATGAPHTSKWHRGALVKGYMGLRPGTAIATFDSDSGYGNHTNGTSHTAIYLGQDAKGIHVIDQWNVRQHGQIVRRLAPHERIIRFNHPGSQTIDQGEYYYVIENGNGCDCIDV